MGFCNCKEPRNIYNYVCGQCLLPLEDKPYSAPFSFVDDFPEADFDDLFGSWVDNRSQCLDSARWAWNKAKGKR